MARLISEILREKEPDFSYKIAHFEKLAGNPAIDLRLISEMTIGSKELIKNLGLDENDTTLKELFFALNKKALDDSSKLATKIGIKPEDTPKDVSKKCVNYVEGLLQGSKIWSLKSSVTKRELKDNPPKKLLKILGLRSVDSALKREPLGEILIFSKAVEQKSWKTTYINNAKKITNFDFGFQPIKIHILSPARQSKLSASGIKPPGLIMKDQETASLIVWVPAKRFPGDVIYIVNSLIDNINKLKLNSLYFKHRSIQPGFYKATVDYRQNGLINLSDHLGVGWPAVSRSVISKNNDLEEFDFDVENEYENLSLPSLLNDDVWGNHFLLKTDENLIISCNLSDVIINAINNLEPEESVIHHGQSALKNELFSRYLEHDGVVGFIVNEDNDG